MKTSRLASLAPLLVALIDQPITIAIGLLPILLVRDFYIGGIYVALVSMMKPVSLFISFFIPTLFSKSRLWWHVLIVGIVSRIPFVFVFLNPQSVTTFISSVVFYLMLSKSIKPIWIESLRIMLKENRSRVFASVSKWVYLEGVIVVSIIGMLLDKNIIGGTRLIALIGMFGVLSSFMQAYFCWMSQINNVELVNKTSFMCDLVNSLSAIRDKKVFRFHLTFFLFGSSCIATQVVLPLIIGPISRQIAYTHISSAITIAKVIGVYISSVFWYKVFDKGVFRSSIIMGIFCCLYNFMIVVTYYFSQSIVPIFLTYVLFGMAIAGSNLIWDIAPTVLCNGKDSIIYSRLNIFMLGLRGMIIPILAGGLVEYSLPCLLFLLTFLSVIGTLLSVYFVNEDVC